MRQWNRKLASECATKGKNGVLDSATIQATLPVALLERLNQEADRRHVSRSQVIREACEKWRQDLDGPESP